MPGPAAPALCRWSHSTEQTVFRNPGSFRGSTETPVWIKYSFEHPDPKWRQPARVPGLYLPTTVQPGQVGSPRQVQRPRPWSGCLPVFLVGAEGVPHKWPAPDNRCWGTSTPRSFLGGQCLRPTAAHSPPDGSHSGNPNRRGLCLMKAADGGLQKLLDQFRGHGDSEPAGSPERPAQEEGRHWGERGQSGRGHSLPVARPSRPPTLPLSLLQPLDAMWPGHSGERERE